MDNLSMRHKKFIKQVLTEGKFDVVLKEDSLIVINGVGFGGAISLEEVEDIPTHRKFLEQLNDNLDKLLGKQSSENKLPESVLRELGEVITLEDIKQDELRKLESQLKSQLSKVLDKAKQGTEEVEYVFQTFEGARQVIADFINGEDLEGYVITTEYENNTIKFRVKSSKQKKNPTKNLSDSERQLLSNIGEVLGVIPTDFISFSEGDNKQYLEDESGEIITTLHSKGILSPFSLLGTYGESGEREDNDFENFWNNDDKDDEDFEEDSCVIGDIGEVGSCELGIDCLCSNKGMETSLPLDDIFGTSKKNDTKENQVDFKDLEESISVLDNYINGLNTKEDKGKELTLKQVIEQYGKVKQSKDNKDNEDKSEDGYGEIVVPSPYGDITVKLKRK